jgi:UDP-N-acetylglucosamine--N-acetylmuramyl-(pentapeptide) pyrophosphoryl-undecaprenol N-acetylglucosamine transferase
MTNFDIKGYKVLPNNTHRIYFSICGEGYGHSSREMAIAEKLKGMGADILVGSYGYVLDRLSKNFDSIELKKEFEMVGNKGSFDLGATIKKSRKDAIHFSSIIKEEKETIGNFEATCVVADGRTAAIFAAFRLGLPCINVSNQTSLEPFFRDSNFLVRLIGKPVELTMQTATTLAEVTLIPDLLPPNTVCLGSLSNSRHIMKKQCFVGPVVSAEFFDSAHQIDMKNPFVLILLGGHSFRYPIFENILKIADRFADLDFLIFTKFKSDHLPPNVKVSEFAPDISSYMKAADLIITQAGHSTAMEILTTGKPALIIPDRGQIEQENNARRMKELGSCETLDYDSLDPESLSSKIRELLNDKRYSEKAALYSGMSKMMNGPLKAAQIVIELSGRMQCY